jgi:hypothetical protein
LTDIIQENDPMLIAVEKSWSRTLIDLGGSQNIA